MTTAALPRVNVVGLGKLGAPLAAVLASRGFTVIGLDVNKTFVDALNAGKMPIVEPQLNELIAENRERLSATMDADEAVQKSDASFVIVPTPSNKETGFFSNSYVLKAMETLGKALRKKNGYHLVVITSTVMPGSTDGEIRAALESASGRKVGPDLGLCYNPEFIALGSVVRDMLYPDSILVGQADQKAGDMLEKIYRQMCVKNPPVQRMNLVSAELTKISVNTYVTTKISYANMLADICDRLPDADVDVVTKAVGADSRVGVKYLRGATGYGGPCFPRDNVSFGALARQLVEVGLDVLRPQFVITGEPLHRFLRRVGVAVDFGAVAGRQQRHFGLRGARTGLETLVQRAQHLHQLLNQHGVDPCKRLVQQDVFGLRGQRTGDFHATAFAA